MTMHAHVHTGGFTLVAKNAEGKAKRMRRTSEVASAAIVEAMAAVSVGDIPNVSGIANVGLARVDNPYSEGPPKVVVLRSLRGDPLGRMHVRRQVDEAQYHAGRFWQACYEASEIGGVGAIDPGKEAVDGGRFPELFTDHQRKAVRRLVQATRVLGGEGDALIRAVLGERQFIEAVAARRGLPRQREIDYLARRFRECLDTLAVEFGFASRK